MTGEDLSSPVLREKIAEWAKPLCKETSEYYAADVIECAQENAELLKILDWLKEHYTSNTWVEIGKR